MSAGYIVWQVVTVRGCSHVIMHARGIRISEDMSAIFERALHMKYTQTHTHPAVVQKIGNCTAWRDDHISPDKLWSERHRCCQSRQLKQATCGTNFEMFTTCTLRTTVFDRFDRQAAIRCLAGLDPVLFSIVDQHKRSLV